MGIWKAIGSGLKRLPWRKIAKYGGAAVGVPVIATETGANAEIAEVTGSAITEHILIVIQAVLGLLTVIVEDKRRKVKGGAA